jgi:hypothetical protein
MVSLASAVWQDVAAARAEMVEFLQQIMLLYLQ